MYIVRNMLKSTLHLSDLGVKIGPRDYVDLDRVGRERVAQSRSLQGALDEGYLFLVKMDGQGPQPRRGSAGAAVAAAPGGSDLLQQIQELKAMLAAASRPGAGGGAGAAGGGGESGDFSEMK
ncbi:MAG: hypothetical protein HY719_12275, partial [Planctomycetes bacterium]|nr:hypothetical protein [Planctomycetota bacterium]